MTKLDTGYGSYKKLISTERTYSVPLYQRNYSWRTTHEIPELWGDITRLYKLRRAGTPSTHFIGSVVIGETPTKALGPGDCPVIDGQQRLITLSLLLAAIRDNTGMDADQKRKVTNNFLVFADHDDALRVVPAQANRAIYEQLIRGSDASDRKSEIFRSYNWFCKKLIAGVPADADFSEEENGGDELSAGTAEAEGVVEESEDSEDAGVVVESQWDWETLLTVIANDLELVSIADIPADRAYQIFATLNHSGLKLGQVDLIRNAVFMKLPTKNAVGYQNIWKPMEDQLGLRVLENHLHAWVILQGKNVPKKGTYAALIGQLNRMDSEPAVLKALEQIRKDASIFQLVDDAGSPAASQIAKQVKLPKEVVKSLRFQSQWGNTPAQPLLVEILTRFRDGQLGSEQAKRAVLQVESLLVRRFICAIAPHDLRSTLARLVSQVRKSPAESFGADLAAALSESVRRWPDDDLLKESAVTSALYRAKNVTQTFLVLKRLAEFLEGKEAPHIERGTESTSYSVEHILPQTVVGTAWFADMAEWGDKEPLHTWSTRRHTLGNLTLTAYNSEMSNSEFAIKRTWIDQHLRLALSKQIVESEVWTKSEIEARSKKLAEIAIEVWPGPLGS
ncbi:hypothetical protein ACVWW9_001228 [Agrococcus sp. UYP33]